MLIARPHKRLHTNINKNTCVINIRWLHANKPLFIFIYIYKHFLDPAYALLYTAEQESRDK